MNFVSYFTQFVRTLSQGALFLVVAAPVLLTSTRADDSQISSTTASPQVDELGARNHVALGLGLERKGDTDGAITEYNSSLPVAFFWLKQTSHVTNGASGRWFCNRLCKEEWIAASATSL